MGLICIKLKDDTNFNCISPLKTNEDGIIEGITVKGNSIFIDPSDIKLIY